MFGFSLTKLLILAVIIFAVWKGFGYLQRRQQVQDSEKHEKIRKSRKETQGSADPVEDMVRCPVCNAFVPANDPSGCGTDKCPNG